MTVKLLKMRLWITIKIQWNNFILFSSLATLFGNTYVYLCVSPPPLRELSPSPPGYQILVFNLVASCLPIRKAKTFYEVLMSSKNNLFPSAKRWLSFSFIIHCSCTRIISFSRMMDVPPYITCRICLLWWYTPWIGYVVI